VAYDPVKKEYQQSWVSVKRTIRSDQIVHQRTRCAVSCIPGIATRHSQYKYSSPSKKVLVYYSSLWPSWRIIALDSSSRHRPKAPNKIMRN